MHHSSGARGTPRAPAQLPDLLWNGQPFVLALPIFRETCVVRTRPVSEARRREFDEQGWPREYILLQEHRLVFIGRHITLAVTTNAAEAEEELPENIVTHVRDLGTYRNATVYWRGREDDAIVSARLTSGKDRKRMKPISPAPRASAGERDPLPPAKPTLDPIIANMLATAFRVLKSGILVTNAQLPAAMSDNERVLTNLLLSKRDDGSGRPLSLAEVGRVLDCSDETVRRRLKKLAAHFPQLGDVILAFREQNQKGSSLPPGPPDQHNPEEQE